VRRSQNVLYTLLTCSHRITCKRRDKPTTEIQMVPTTAKLPRRSGGTACSHTLEQVKSVILPCFRICAC
jgi:hypothetical protein